jgi:Na+/glutamate symporter
MAYTPASCEIDYWIQLSVVIGILLVEFYVGKSKKIKQSSSLEIAIFVGSLVVGIILNLIRRKKNEST